MKLTKKVITDFLKAKGSYDPIFDYVIEDLLFNLEVADELKNDIRTRGAVIEIGNTGQMITNTSLTAYNVALKQVMLFSSRLGLDFKAIKDLKLDNKTEDDGFDS